METKPDTIKVNASQREEIQATRADLMVTVKGSSLISGDAALKKAKEVSQLVDELTRFGLPADAIHLQSVYAEASNGALLRSSSATYRLRIRCEKLEQFADLLGIVASQKNATFERVEWKYPDETAQETALEKALGKAGAKARNVATALGVKLLGVYSLNENTFDQEQAPRPEMMFAAQAQARGMGAAPQVDLGMDIQHSKTIEVRVEIEYRVSEFACASPAPDAGRGTAGTGAV
jgi:uncharacterized protein YggE